MTPWWLLTLLIFGVNFAFWGVVGVLRWVDSTLSRRRAAGTEDAADGVRVGLDQVAVLMPAHNEETVIASSLAAITALVPAANVHVVSDGSTDRTCELAEQAGVHVMSTSENRGKAGALQEAIGEFDLVDRFRVVMFLDADTVVDPGYFTAALPLFDDPRVVAVAGCVRSSWRGRDVSWFGKVVSFHRQRIYALTQYLLKFGQTWRFLNATHIVPGFASLYRTDVLPHIEMNPPGLVIEDFNMTFEVYQKGLGRVGFTPSAVALTQEPTTPRDYVRQTKRWALGLWQTVRRHPPRANLFSAMLSLLLLELLTSAVLVVLLPLLMIALSLPALLGELPAVVAVHDAVVARVTFLSVLFGVLLPDAVLTCVVAAFTRQPRFLLHGWCFLPLRILDAVIALVALPLAWWRSTGRWSSPNRRVLDEAELSDAADVAAREETDAYAG